MVINRRTFLGTSTAATALLAAPTLLKAQPKEYIIGTSLPLTGPFATAGQLVAPAVELASAIINDEGGFGGVPVRMTIDDSGYVAQNTLANYQRSLATHGDAMIGYLSDSTAAMKLLAPELKGENARVMWSPSYATELANTEEHPYQFMPGPTYASQVDILLEDIAAEGGGSVAFIYSNTEFGRDPIEHGRKTAERLGLKVVLEEATRPQGADIPTHVTQLAQSGADYCILHGYTTGVWPQLIGGARQFGLPTQFRGTFWGMEKLIADRVTEEAGPLLKGYRGVLPFRYFWEQEEAPRYQVYAGKMKELFAGTPIENYLSTWALQVMCGMEIAAKACRDTIEADKPLTADNIAQAVNSTRGWDSGGFFGGPVDIVDNAIGMGRIYEFDTETRLFNPTSDWRTV